MNKDALKMPVVTDFTAGAYSDIKGVLCRKKGLVSVDFCVKCPEFVPAVRIKQEDPLEGSDGIDPHTGNSSATCKWFGEIVRERPLFGARRIARWRRP